jgi:hypothetical protein
MRGLLERFAARRILANPARPGGRLGPLRAACDEMQRCAEADDLKGLSAADERFHRALIDLAGHDLLRRHVVADRAAGAHVMGLRNAQLRDPLRVAANHRAIVDALAAGDLDRSARADHRPRRVRRAADPRRVAGRRVSAPLRLLLAGLGARGRYWRTVIEREPRAVAVGLRRPSPAARAAFAELEPGVPTFADLDEAVDAVAPTRWCSPPRPTPATPHLDLACARPCRCWWRSRSRSTSPPPRATSERPSAPASR